MGPLFSINGELSGILTSGIRITFDSIEIDCQEVLIDSSSPPKSFISVAIVFITPQQGLVLCRGYVERSELLSILPFWISIEGKRNFIDKGIVL